MSEEQGIISKEMRIPFKNWGERATISKVLKGHQGASFGFDISDQDAAEGDFVLTYNQFGKADIGYFLEDLEEARASK